MLLKKNFQAYFTDGIYLDDDNLVSIAADLGLDSAEARKVIANKENLENIVGRNKHWRNSGVKGDLVCSFQSREFYFHLINWT